MSKCKTCFYYGLSTGTCDFLLTTGVRRGCPADNCLRYIPDNGHRRVQPLVLPRGRKPVREDDPRWIAMRALYEQGLSDARIGEKVGVCKTTVRRWRHRVGLPPVPRKGGHSDG